MGAESTFLGLSIALLFIALTGYYPGGIIVPAYLVLFMDQPLRIIGTLLAALLTLLCYRAASRYLILFGRRRFVFMILFGGIWTFLWLLIFPVILPVSVDFRVIGWVIPGLIANNFERQGIIITTAALVTVMVFTFFSSRVFTILFGIL